MNIFLDTDVIIDHAKKKNDLLITLGKQQNVRKITLCTNAVVIAEYFAGQQLANAELAERTKREIFSKMTVLPMTRAVGILAGSFIRENKTLGLGDALIAATCIEEQCLLATRNTKHYQKIPGLGFYSV